MTKTHPMLCTDSVVRAILAGRQTQDRRPVSYLTCLWNNWRGRWTQAQAAAALEAEWVFPRVHPGDLLYCREAFAERYFDDGSPAYAADWHPGLAGVIDPPRWTPSIHMPKRSARIWLRVEWVRIERLQAIDEAGARAEGCDGWESFADLWNGLYEAKGWAWKTNPWVVACGFTVASRTGRACVEVSP